MSYGLRTLAWLPTYTLYSCWFRCGNNKLLFGSNDVTDACIDFDNASEVQQQLREPLRLIDSKVLQNTLSSRLAVIVMLLESPPSVPSQFDTRSPFECSPLVWTLLLRPSAMMLLETVTSCM